MTAFESFQIAQFVVMGAVAVLLWTMRSIFTTGRITATAEARLTALEKRMDRAGAETSSLATAVQALPETLRRDFLPRELAQFYFDENRADRARLSDRIDRLENRL